MPSPKYAGSPTGSGNPPGKYSEGYLSPMESAGHFNEDASYRGSMNVGINSKAKVVGNQPSGKSMFSLESEANLKNPL